MIYPNIMRFDFREDRAAYHKRKMESYRSGIDEAINTPIIGRYLAHYYRRLADRHERKMKMHLTRQ